MVFERGLAVTNLRGSCVESFPTTLGYPRENRLSVSSVDTFGGRFQHRQWKPPLGRRHDLRLEDGPSPENACHGQARSGGLKGVEEECIAEADPLGRCGRNGRTLGELLQVRGTEVPLRSSLLSWTNQSCASIYRDGKRAKCAQLVGR